MADAWQASAHLLLDHILQKWDPPNQESTVQFAQLLHHFQRSYSSAVQQVVYPGHFKPPLVKVSWTFTVCNDIVMAFQEKSMTIRSNSTHSTFSLFSFFFGIKVSELISEHLLQLLHAESQGTSQKSQTVNNPLVFGFSLFRVCQACQIDLGVKGWAELCCLVSSHTALDSRNIEEFRNVFSFPQKWVSDVMFILCCLITATLSICRMKSVHLSFFVSTALWLVWSTAAYRGWSQSFPCSFLYCTRSDIREQTLAGLVLL